MHMGIKVAIIGAGIGGLATAVRLANAGYQVHVFEKNSYPGGKLSQIDLGKYRFDAGPSLFTMPQFVEDLFKEAGEDISAFFEYSKLEDICHYFWEDGTTLTAFSDLDVFSKEIEVKLSVNAAPVRQYLTHASNNYKLLSPLFIESSLHSWKTWLSKAAFKGYKNIFNLGLFHTLHQKNRRTLNHPKLIQLFDRYATYNGSDPYQTPATMGIIPHLEFNVGAFFPKKGMVNIPLSIEALAKKLGVHFHYQADIQEIVVEKERVTGIHVQDTFETFDVVVSNMDVTPTYRKLLPKSKAPEKILNQDRSGSGLIFYWGVRERFENLGVHNIFFSDNYQEEFRYQFEEKDIFNDPTVYVHISSKEIKEDAPEYGENWFVLINAPANEGQNWEEIRLRTRRNVLDKLSRILKRDIEPLLEEEDFLDPTKIELRTSSSQGALYGTSSNSKFSAFFRHPNFSSQYSNLFFVGGSVHPGGGIPLALSSAKITSEFIINSQKS